jgi:DNA primase
LLPARDWLAAAQALPEGGRGRINHTCGEGRTLLIKHERDRWSSYCFRCDEPGIEQKPTESWQERLERLTREQGMDAALRRSVALPGPPEFDVQQWPAAARVWLYKAGIGRPEIEELGAYWHRPTGRLVLPIFEGEQLIYWQARDVSWTRASKRAKYVNPDVDKQRLVAKYGRGNPLVLTEDVLSAFRVGQVTEAWSLLGTSLSDPVAASIKTSRPVRVWLDPDPAGRKAARTITQQLRSQGLDAQRIEARADPKLLSRREIEHHLRHS